MEIRRTPIFDDWLGHLKDRVGRARIADRIDRLAEGNPGDSRSVGDGVLELRLHFGPGYRVYYIYRGDVILLLLCGGDKSTQSEDIRRAKEIANEPDEEE